MQPSHPTAAFSFARAKCYALGMDWRIPTVEKTQAAAKELLASLTPHSAATVLGLHGDLGAGKTTFVQALAAELGVADVVTSPTFVVLKQYPLESDRWQQLVHVDAYRLDHASELETLGFRELLQEPKTLICVEWAERVADILPADTLHLNFKLMGEHRIISERHE